MKNKKSQPKKKSSFFHCSFFFLLGSSTREPRDLRVLAVGHDVPLVVHKVVVPERPDQRRDEVEGDGPGALGGLAVVLPEDGLGGLGRLDEVVVRDLGEEVVDDVRADVVVDLVEDAIVAVDGGEAPPEVGPLLAAEPRHLLVLVRGAVVVEVGDDVEPDDVDPVGDHVEGEDVQGAQQVGGGGEDAEHADHERVGGLDEPSLGLDKEVALRVVVRALLAGGALPEVEGEGEHGPGQRQAARAAGGVHAV